MSVGVDRENAVIDAGVADPLDILGGTDPEIGRPNLHAKFAMQEDRRAGLAATEVQNPQAGTQIEPPGRATPPARANSRRRWRAPLSSRDDIWMPAEIVWKGADRRRHGVASDSWTNTTDHSCMNANIRGALTTIGSRKAALLDRLAGLAQRITQRVRGPGSFAARPNPRRTRLRLPAVARRLGQRELLLGFLRLLLNHAEMVMVEDAQRLDGYETAMRRSRMSSRFSPFLVSAGDEKLYEPR